MFSSARKRSVTLSRPDRNSIQQSCCETPSPQKPAVWKAQRAAERSYESLVQWLTL